MSFLDAIKRASKLNFLTQDHIDLESSLSNNDTIIQEMIDNGTMSSPDTSAVQEYEKTFGNLSQRNIVGNIDLRKLRHDIASDPKNTKETKNSPAFKDCFDE